MLVLDSAYSRFIVFEDREETKSSYPLTAHSGSSKLFGIEVAKRQLNQRSEKIKNSS